MPVRMNNPQPADVMCLRSTSRRCVSFCPILGITHGERCEVDPGSSRPPSPYGERAQGRAVTAAAGPVSGTAATLHAHSDAYRHEALFYAGDDDFVTRLVPFIQGGVDRDEPVLVVVSAPKIERLRATL